MKTYLNRVAWLLVLLALGTSCGGEPALWVRLAEWPTKAATLNVVPWLNGIRNSAIIVPQDSPGFVVTLPEGTTGELRLQIVALDSELCKIGTTEVTAALGPALRVTREQVAQFEMLKEPVCTLSLDLPLGVSVINPSPLRLACSPEGVRCEADFSKYSTVTIEPSFDHHTYAKLSAYGAICDEEGTCSIDMDRSKHSQVQLTARACSEKGFCSYRVMQQEGALNGVWGNNADTVWAVGAGGTVLKWNGKAWAAQPSGTTQDLYSVGGSAADAVWAVGASGTILRWDGIAWSSLPSGTLASLYGVWSSDANNAWAVGTGGTILRWNGKAWSSLPSGTTEHLYSVWGSDANNIWAVGDYGTTRKWNGWTLTAHDDTNIQTLYAVWGSDVNNVWSAQKYGWIFKWEGEAWVSKYINSPSHVLYGVWTSGANHVWIVGQRGTIRKWDGSTLSSQDSGTEDLRGVWGSSQSDIWVVGGAGTILRRK